MLTFKSLRSKTIQIVNMSNKCAPQHLNVILETDEGTVVITGFFSGKSQYVWKFTSIQIGQFISRKLVDPLEK